VNHIQRHPTLYSCKIFQPSSLSLTEAELPELPTSALDMPHPHSPPPMQVNPDSIPAFQPLGTVPSHHSLTETEPSITQPHSPNSIPASSTTPSQALTPELRAPSPQNESPAVTLKLSQLAQPESVMPSADQGLDTVPHPIPRPDCQVPNITHNQAEYPGTNTDTDSNQLAVSGRCHEETTPSSGNSVELVDRPKVGGKKREGKGGTKSKAKAMSGRTGSVEDGSSGGNKLLPACRSKDSSTVTKDDGADTSIAATAKQVNRKRTRPMDENVQLIDGRRGLIRRCQ
jgi:hypothetical protein